MLDYRRVVFVFFFGVGVRLMTLLGELKRVGLLCFFVFFPVFVSLDR